MGAHILDMATTSGIMPSHSFGRQTATDRSVLEVAEKDPSQMLPDPEELQRQADGVNDLLEATYTNLKFNVHDKLDRVFVQVLERDTEEVIREIPPEKFLDMKAAILELVGLLVDEKV